MTSGQLVELTEQAYDSEALLQKLLSDYPSLLAGDQIDSVTPRRWLLIKPEMEVPSEEDGYGRWFIDHLFLDQDGIPTLVEVKRSSDTRLRREVVGQMLDYVELLHRLNSIPGISIFSVARGRPIFASVHCRHKIIAKASFSGFLSTNTVAVLYNNYK